MVIQEGKQLFLHFFDNDSKKGWGTSMVRIIINPNAGITVFYDADLSATPLCEEPLLSFDPLIDPVPDGIFDASDLQSYLSSISLDKLIAAPVNVTNEVDALRARALRYTCPPEQAFRETNAQDIRIVVSVKELDDFLRKATALEKGALNAFVCSSSSDLVMEYRDGSMIPFKEFPGVSFLCSEIKFMTFEEAIDALQGLDLRSAERDDIRHVFDTLEQYDLTLTRDISSLDKALQFVDAIRGKLFGLQVPKIKADLAQIPADILEEMAFAEFDARIEASMYQGINEDELYGRATALVKKFARHALKLESNSLSPNYTKMGNLVRDMGEVPDPYFQDAITQLLASKRYVEALYLCQHFTKNDEQAAALQRICNAMSEAQRTFYSQLILQLKARTPEPRPD
ncbi:MAG: hypothetical protein A3I05_03170 [Deltaproteobacteria bacterium RIFCSPLOWO2_02_FULL_44_10]|nr:MAG: hypothetical protein A3C46_08955 [Deltaproteobacteria bacterium RIFCSPHIGHO2_02_FULL_44_16]OGQ46879.1 MAG: hypothetical protein A3I05_03170 [Deltaproteobacteria bacterium RIFCSPLOWO2_02_FULL_44_10]